MKKIIQWENRGSARLATWLRVTRSILEEYTHIEPRRFKFSHIPLEGISKLENIKKSRLGMEPGVPDFIVSIPPEISISGQSIIIFIELKEPSDITGKVSRATPEQLEWLSLLAEAPSVYTKICIGYQEAITFILDHLSVPVKWRLHKVGQIELIENRVWVRKLLEEIEL